MEPSCGKCIKKGIECSGLARIRFNEGVARRGRLKNCAIPVLQVASQDGNTSCMLPTEVTFPELQWHSHKPPRSTHSRRAGASKGRTRSKPCPQQPGQDQLEASSCLSSGSSVTAHDDTISSPGSQISQDEQPQEVALSTQDEHCGEEIETIVRANVQPQSMQQIGPTHSIMPWIAPIPSETRGLFYHCEQQSFHTILGRVPRLTFITVSEAVAPVMVILDKVSNGYREFILPMALQDDVLCRAVAVVSAQHLSQGNPALEMAAEKGRAAVISRLRRDASLASQVFNEFTWATLIVLLVGETVTGNADYSFLVQMMLCLANNDVIRTKESPLTRFLGAQTHM